jgi:hypothetical protein
VAPPATGPVPPSLPLVTFGAGHQAYLHDPFGNFIELNQPE